MKYQLHPAKGYTPSTGSKGYSASVAAPYTPGANISYGNRFSMSGVNGNATYQSNFSVKYANGNEVNYTQSLTIPLSKGTTLTYESNIHIPFTGTAAASYKNLAQDKNKSMSLDYLAATAGNDGASSMDGYNTMKQPAMNSLKKAYEENMGKGPMGYDLRKKKEEDEKKKAQKNLHCVICKAPTGRDGDLCQECLNKIQNLN